jgi:peptide/nickel transport system permease protein
MDIRKPLAPKLKEARLSLHLLNRNLLARICLILLLCILAAAVAAPLLAPYPGDAITDTHPENALAPMSAAHPFGTDELGRDILSRIIYGARISISTAIFTVLVAVVIGCVIGVLAGGSGGWPDEVLMRFTDMFLSFPPLLLAIAIAALLGPSLGNAQIAIIAAWWPSYARLIRGQAISVKERQFVKAAEAIGTRAPEILFRHVLPNCIAPLIIEASLDMGGVILTVASLSFLGLGAQPPTPEWGLMVSTSRNYFMNAQWYSIWPGLAIFFTVLAFNILGDGLREVLDPKTRKN